MLLKQLGKIDVGVEIGCFSGLYDQ